MEQLSMFDEKPPKRSYKNTNKIAGAELRKAETSAREQEGNILAIYQASSILSPSECWTIYQQKFGPILLTSVRRGITDLTNEGKLTKTSVRRIGIYGSPEYIWKINN